MGVKGFFFNISKLQWQKTSNYWFMLTGSFSSPWHLQGPGNLTKDSMTYWKTEETSSNRPLFEALRPTLKKEVGSREENSIHLPKINAHPHPCPNLDFAHTRTLTTSWRRAVKELPPYTSTFFLHQLHFNSHKVHFPACSEDGAPWSTNMKSIIGEI